MAKIKNIKPKIMSTKLSSLKESQKELQYQLGNVNTQIQKIEDETNLPSIKQKFEGRYFKVANSSHYDNVWDMYSFCKEVINNREGIFQIFQSAIGNGVRYELSRNHQSYLKNIGQEITAEEYYSELEKFKKVILES